MLSALPAQDAQVNALVLRVADLDAAVAHLHAQKVATEPVRVDEYTGRRFTFFADPDDLPLELYEQ